MDAEEQIRVDAVKRYMKGDKPSNIYKEANRSKKWLYKWVNRFKTGDEGWFQSRSRRPKHQGQKIGEDIERTIVSIRKALMDGNEDETKYLGVGADAIQYRMDELDITVDEMPSVSTIKRIVKKHGLKVNKRERYKRVKSKKRYTILNPTQIDEMHQMDFIGPRFIKGYGAISSLNIIDVVCNRAHIEQYNAKSTDNAIEFLINYWSNNTIPRYLQVDNGMYFIGDFRYPRGFSRFIRLCLYVGVQLVFIAPGCPWMNGNIENFNKWFGGTFWEKETFESLEDIRIKSKHFISQHNNLSTWKKRDKCLTQIKSARMLKNCVKINSAKLPLTEGKIHFIRVVDNGGKINVLNELFEVGKEFTSEYVWATICLKKQKIKVYYRDQDKNTAMMIKEFDYDPNEVVKPHGQDIWKT